MSLSHKTQLNRTADGGTWNTTQELRRIIDALPFLVSFIDQDGTFRFCNKHFKYWFEQPISSLEGKHLKDVFSPALYRSVSPDLAKAMSGRRFTSEATIEFPDGMTRRVRRSYIPCNSDAGELIGCFSLVQDVMDLVDTQVELGRERDLFEGVFRALPDAIALLSANREIFMCNASFTRQFGYRSDEVIGRETKFLYHEHGEYERRNLIASKTAGDDNAPQTIKYVRKDGAIFSGEIQHAAIHDREGRFIANLEIMRDNSAGEKIQYRRAHSQKMEAIGNVTGAIAHDFNNLLMVIGGYTRRAITHREDSEAMMKDLEAVMSATDKAGRLTAQMLTFSHRQIMDRSLFSVDQNLADAEAALLTSLGRDHDLRIVMNDKGVCIDTDAHEFGQAIRKLVDNAQDAMPDGGTIEINTQCITIGQKMQTTLQYLLPGDYVRIDITDTGLGIESDILSRIFEPFFTTKDEIHGTGLSLAMVYGFAQQSRGGVEIETTPGQGTTIQLYLPVSTRTSDTYIVEVGVDTAGTDETILLVEDDEALLGLTREILNDLGYKILTARDGLQALVLEEKYAGKIDLMLSDVVMPGMGGFDLAEAICSNRPDMKFAFMSGYNNRYNSRADIPVGAPFLQKPVTPECLAQTIRSALDTPRLPLS